MRKRITKRIWPLLLAPKQAFFGMILFGATLSFGTLFNPLSLNAQSHSDTLQQLETAFIFQFTNYIEWPETDSEHFVISVLGNYEALPYLEELAGKKLVKGKEIRVLFAKDLSQLKKSQIVFVHTDNEELLRQVAKENKGALIVSHGKGFAEKGAMINFFEEDERLRFEINRRALEGQKLVVSSQLLKLARIVE